MNNRRIAVLIAGFLTVLVGFGVRSSYGVLLPKMQPSMGISRAEAGMIYGSFFVAYTAFSPILGLLADRMNMRVIFTIFPVILGIGTFLMGYCSNYLEAMGFFFMAGIGTSVSWAPIVPLVQRWTSGKRRGMTLSIVDSGASIGVGLTGAVIPFIVTAWDWRMGWKSLGMIALFIGAANYLLVRDHPLEHPDPQGRGYGPHRKQPFRGNYMECFGDSKFLLIGISYLFIGFSAIIPQTFISIYAVQELGLRYDLAASLVTISAITAIPGRLVLGALSDRLGRVKAIMLCQILIGLGIFGIIHSPGFFALSLCTAIIGIGIGSVYVLYALCAPDYFHRSSPGFIVGSWTLFLGVGFILSPIIAGWIADETGRFMWSFVLGIATTILSMMLLVVVGKTYSSKVPE